MKTCENAGSRQPELVHAGFVEGLSEVPYKMELTDPDMKK